MGPAVTAVPRTALTSGEAEYIFDLAQNAPVLIKGYDEATPDMVLLNAEQYDAMLRFIGNLYLVALAQEKGAEEMPGLAGMEWSKYFSLAERRSMLSELLTSAQSACEQNDATVFNAMWKGWFVSAEAMADPEMRKRLTAQIDHTRTIPLPRP